MKKLRLEEIESCPKVIISGRIRGRLACRELQGPREGRVYGWGTWGRGALRALGGEAFSEDTEVGFLHLQQPGAWLSGEIPHPWGGRISPNSVLPFCSFYFPSDCESPLPSPPPPCLGTFGSPLALHLPAFSSGLDPLGLRPGFKGAQLRETRRRHLWGGRLARLA